MKNTLLLIACLTTLTTWSQNVLVDVNTYTPQQLIEDVLIDSNCITNVVVTNVIGGDFGGTDQSYGYFDATGSSFPFQNGIVLSTGRLNNVQGPNASLSDDDAPNWVGDSDLEAALNESNTLNATIIEFDFVSVANQISFKYLFASEEYQEGNSNTCQYSDLFGFLIRPESETQYTNIAVIPGTSTPVKVTTVHSGIPGSCNPINEQYFGSWNDNMAPINFNGQTTVLTATANVVPNQTYHVKLVIADEQNYRYDSAVFLEAGSFQLQINLGDNKLLANDTALCINETLTLDAEQPGTNTYKWFKNGVEIPSETNSTYTVTEQGIYNVEVIINSSCLSLGEVTIEYAPNPTVANTTLFNCDYDLDGFTTYNLLDAIQAITLGDTNLNVDAYYETLLDANQDNNAISTPTAYNNTSLLQTVYAKISNRNSCTAFAEILLDYPNNQVNLPPYIVCDDEPLDGISTFSLETLETYIVSQSDVPNTASVTFYNSQDDLINQSNPITGTYENTTPYSGILYIQITDNGMCYAYTTLDLIINPIPELEPDETVIYCLNMFPDTIILHSGIINDSPNNYTYQWFLNGVDLLINSEQIQINRIGEYIVTATNSNNCMSSRNVLVEASNIATIESISVIEASDNNSITITVSGEGNYEYALNYGVYQDGNIFTHLVAGYYTVHVRDKNGCGIILEETAILGFPKFFTPNNDGYNDTWNPLGVSNKNMDLRVRIFNRYGKLIKEINTSQNSWNGTFNGQKLPSDDYWYLVISPNGKTYQGHFTLKR